jgi:hypothetical protein
MQNRRKQSKLFSLNLLVLFAISLLILACSCGPTEPQQSSAERYWQAAIDNYKIPDYPKTKDQLEQVMNSEGELSSRAMLWLAVLNAGLAHGYDELADAFTEGIKTDESKIEDFQSYISNYRRSVRMNAIEFAEGAGKIKAFMGSEESIAFDFPLPSGDASVSPLLTSVRSGTPVSTTGQMNTMETLTLTRGIFAVIDELCGAEGDFEKLVSEAEAGGISISSTEFGFGVSRILLNIAMMFDRENINDPRVRRSILEMAKEWAEPYYEDESLADRVEDFKFDAENENLDLIGKPKIEKKD